LSKGKRKNDLAVSVLEAERFFQLEEGVFPSRPHAYLSIQDGGVFGIIMRKIDAANHNRESSQLYTAAVVGELNAIRPQLTKKFFIENFSLRDDSVPWMQ